MFVRAVYLEGFIRDEVPTFFLSFFLGTGTRRVADRAFAFLERGALFVFGRSTEEGKLLGRSLLWGRYPTVFLEKVLFLSYTEPFPLAQFFMKLEGADVEHLLEEVIGDLGVKDFVFDEEVHGYHVVGLYAFLDDADRAV